MTIYEEFCVFLSALCSGMFSYSLYYLLEMIRNEKKIPAWAVNIGDIFYWIIVGNHVFVQIDNTNNGMIRGYYVLGLVLGAVILWKIFRTVREKWKKFVHPQNEKKIDNFPQNR